MRKFYCTLMFILVARLTFAQCPSGEITYTTQAAVDNFKITYPACVSATSLRLRLDGSEVSNLNGLSNLTSIQALELWSTSVTSLSGVSNLVNIPGSLVIAYNDALPNLSGMTALRSIGYIQITSGQFSSLAGLENVETISGGSIDFNQYLNDISALSGVPGAGRTDVFNNSVLSNCAIEFICAGVRLRPGMLAAMVYSNAPGCNSIGEITTSCGALPVTLTEFKASTEGATGMLTWTTTSESNSSHFEIERSQNGKTWMNIGKVLAGGDRSAAKIYTFKDNAPAPGHNYYRLKMVDIDQTFAYSAIEGIRIGGDNDIIFPNPVTEKLLLRNTAPAGIEEILIYNGSGKMLRVTQNFQNGISVSHLPSGLYLARVTSKNGTTTSHKFIKK